jgi:hypothetical protein
MQADGRGGWSHIRRQQNSGGLIFFPFGLYKGRLRVGLKCRRCKKTHLQRTGSGTPSVVNSSKAFLKSESHIKFLSTGNFAMKEYYRTPDFWYLNNNTGNITLAASKSCKFRLNMIRCFSLVTGAQKEMSSIFANQAYQ